MDPLIHTPLDSTVAQDVEKKEAEPKTPLMFSERRRMTGPDFPAMQKKRNL